VACATSKQGRSVVRTLLASGRYRVRGLTRDVSGPVARELQACGVELAEVAAGATDPRRLTDALRGASAAFLMTPPTAPALPPAQPEFAHGRALADAALAAGVSHVVWSGLENVAARTAGAKWAPHFTEKALVEEHLRGLPLRSSFLYLAFFYSNFIEYYPPRRERDGTLTFPVYFPEDAVMPFVDPLTATGPAVLEMLDRPEQYAGRALPVIGEQLSARQLVETFSRVTGQPARYACAYSRAGLLEYVPALRGDDATLDEVLGMAEYAVEYGYYAPERDLTWSRRIDPHALTWADFLRRTGWRGDAPSVPSM
jgi:uncharacterized protein YbjT (DUF2867 family)